MKVKDAAVALLFWIGIMVFGFFLITIDSIPLWFLLVLAVLVWGVYVLILFRDAARAKRHPTMWIPVQTDQGPMEVAVDGSNRIRPYDPPRNVTIFDQYASKKEKA